MAIKTKTFTLSAFILALACLVALIVGFASDRWVVSTEKEVSGFKNLGLWSACFSRYRPPPWALVDKYYDGCWWVFDREMDELRQFLFPPWFVGTQILVSISLAFQLCAMVVMIVNAINCFPYHKFKDRIALGLSILAALLHASTAILMTVAVIMFGARADNERTWLEKPDQNYLSWSFGMGVLAAFLAILSAMMAALEFYRLRLWRGGEPQAYLTTIPPPASPYAYTAHKFQPGYSEKASQDHPQPAYANRYSNQNSQSMQAKPPNTMFAVSGSGEVYVNRAYMNDDNVQRGRTNGYGPPHDRRQVNPPAYKDLNLQVAQTNSDKVDSQRLQQANAAPKSGNVSVKKSEGSANDYVESKKIKQPVLPEYVPKSKSETVKKINIDNTLDESCDTEAKDDVKKKKLDSDDEKSKDKQRSRSQSKSKKSSSRSSSKKHKKTSKDDDRHLKHRSKTRGNESDDSDEKRSRSRSRSQKRTSRSKRRQRSQSRESNSHRRQKSRDTNSSESDSSSHSDSASVASRSRQKHRNSKRSSSKDGRHCSAPKDSTRKEKHGHLSHEDVSSKKRQDGGHPDDMSGSEYSSKRRSKSKGDPVGPDGKKKANLRDFSDTESVRSRKRSKGRGNQSEPDGKKKAKSRDYSDTESVRSRQSRRSDHKPKGTYSSYYEY